MGFVKRVWLPSGRRADAVNWTTREVLVKEDNMSVALYSELQLAECIRELEQMTGQTWTGRVVPHAS
ncbi:MAG: hypothetical protein IPM64_16685 [Phycisphaerales bacterium]|nr:hypothetical protein [Phycisphaerales bacterium]